MFAGKLNDCIHSVESIWWNLTVLVNSFPRPSRVYLLNRMLLVQTSVNKGFKQFWTVCWAVPSPPPHFLLVLLIRSYLCSRYARDLIILCLSCPRTHHTSCLLSPAEFMIKVHVSYYNISRCCINPPSPVLPRVSPDSFDNKGRFILLHSVMKSGWLFLCWFVGNGKKEFRFIIYGIYSWPWFKRCPTNELACPHFPNITVIDFDFTWVVRIKSIICCKTRKFAKWAAIVWGW